MNEVTKFISEVIFSVITIAGMIVITAVIGRAIYVEIKDMFRRKK